MTPEDIKKIKDLTNLPVIVKGIQSPEDAEVAISAGADGIWVSNHGGRQLDGGPASFEVLPKVQKLSINVFLLSLIQAYAVENMSSKL